MAKIGFDESRPLPDWSGLSGRLRALALGLSRSHADADDLTQQTLVSLLAKRPDRVDHWGYARKTMLRLWLDQQRSLRRRVRRLAQVAAAARPWRVPRDGLSDRDQYERVRRAIVSLPPRQRAILVLRLIEELDYKEIAEVLDCSVQTVRANLHLGRRRVREELGEEP